MMTAPARIRSKSGRLAEILGGEAPQPSNKAKPTRELFAAYRATFRYLNKELFAGSLPEPVLNLSRHANCYGFFAAARWQRATAAGAADVAHEISLNPDTMIGREPRDVAATLAHEMAHLWQEEHGKPQRRGYHDQEWAAKMDEIGLVPSSTGAPGGKRTGQKMSHYVSEGGRFAVAFAAMPPECLLPWTSRATLVARGPARGPAGGGEGGEDEGGEGAEPKPKDPSKVKYTCSGACACNVWGKVGLAILCGECAAPFLRA